MKMNNEMIVKIEKYLENVKQKKVKINQNGFIMSQYFIDKLMYKIHNDVLNLRDETKEVYLSLNLNQVYQVEIGESKIILILDNDTEIELSK